MNIALDSPIYVAGHRGLVGNAVVEELKRSGFSNIIVRTHSDLDLTDQKATQDFFESTQPEYVVDCAAKVGGVKVNLDYPAEFLYENLLIQNNLIWSAKNVGVKKFVFLGSSCIYPKDCPQPIKEEYFMQGVPEATKEAYAFAKIAGAKLCEYVSSEFNLNFISCMPTNIYGQGDNFDPESSHVIPSLIRKIHDAKVNNQDQVLIWGTGEAKREFLHVNDLASAIVFLLENYEGKEFLNIGTGEDVSIGELAKEIKRIVGYDGELDFDVSKPDGMARRLLDVSKLSALGWKYSIKLEDGLKDTYAWYVKQLGSDEN